MFSGGETLRESCPSIGIAIASQELFVESSEKEASRLKEKYDDPTINCVATCAGAFDSVDGADRAIRLLLAAGYSRDEIAVICPAKFVAHFLPAAPRTEVPQADAPSVLAAGGAMGATLGGLALMATALTGDAAGIVTAAVYVGGGAIAGGFSNLIVSKGYQQEADDQYKQAINRGLIVVGVEIHGEDQRLGQARRILDIAGGSPLNGRGTSSPL